MEFEVEVDIDADEVAERIADAIRAGDLGDYSIQGIKDALMSIGESEIDAIACSIRNIKMELEAIERAISGD